jgi:hypothetical protein
LGGVANLLLVVLLNFWFIRLFICSPSADIEWSCYSYGTAQLFENNLKYVLQCVSFLKNIKKTSFWCANKVAV